MRIKGTSDAELGSVLLLNGYPEQAIHLLQRDHSPASRLNLAIAYRQTNRLLASQDILMDLCRLEDIPLEVSCSAFNTLGMLHADFGRFERSEAAFECAHSLIPQQQTALNLGYAKLRLQKFKEALPLFEAGRYKASWRPMDGTEPWRGECGDLLIVSEGGFGDAFLFSRFLDPACRRASSVCLSLWKSLECTGYWKNDESADFNVSWHDGNPFECLQSDHWRVKFDFTTSLMSLMAVFGMESVQSIPPFRPPRFNGTFDRSLTPPGGIGVCWEAEENGVRRRHRSIPVDELAPLRDSTSLPLFSLCPFSSCPPWMVKKDIQSWRDTMAVLLGLDLVISVDTAAAHLACLMGIPTIILLPSRSDWKWFTNSPESPWWPTASLVRNCDPFSWTPAIQEVCRRLAK